MPRPPAVGAWVLGMWLTLLGCCPAAAPPAAGPAPATPGAREAALYDPAAGRFLLLRSATARTAVGSLVKLMTARLAIESGDLGRLITIPAEVAGLPETKAGLIPGRRLSLSVLLQALLIRSANDAAVSIATGLAGGEPAFALRMNAEAAHLGLSGTHYVDSSGLDAPGQWSSARDVAVLAAADLRLPGLAAIVERPSVALPGGRVYKTVNPFLAFYPGATGVKTGFTSDARFCLAASADRGGRILIAVVLGEPGWAAADGDAATLLDWGFASAPAPAGAVGPAAGGARDAATTASSQMAPRVHVAPRVPPVAPRPAAAPGAGSPTTTPSLAATGAARAGVHRAARPWRWWAPAAVGGALLCWAVRRRTGGRGRGAGR